METITYFVLVPMVYFAFGVFTIGTVVRMVKIFKAPAHPSTLQIFPARKPSWFWVLYDTFLFPTVRKHKPLLWVFLILFHLCLALLVLGHIELFGEIELFQVIPHEVFLGKGFIGLLTATALLYFLFRRLLSPIKDLSVPEDYYLLILLFLIVLFGSQMDWARRWYDYSDMGVTDYRLYLGSLIRFAPELPENLIYSGHAFMLVLHVFFANLFLIFFPFSQSMHAFMALPLNKLRRG